MSIIPEDIYLDILLRVPVKSSFVCKCVCKTWFSLLSDPGFARMHLDFTAHRNISSKLIVRETHPRIAHKDVIYSLSYDSLELSPWENEFSVSETYYPYKSLGHLVDILGSCNGLVCLMFFNGLFSEFFCIWNPATHEYKKTTEPQIPYDYDDMWMRAFGYDNRNDDYKLEIAENIGQGSSSSLIHVVYTFGSDSWKSVLTIPYCAYSYDRTSGLLVNGGFHWLANSQQGKLIVYLDITSDRLEEIELPIELQKNGDSLVAVLEGCLSVFVDPGYYPSPVEVWVMRDYGVQEYWAKRYTITHEIIIRTTLRWRSIRSLSLRSFKNGGILFMIQGKLVLYDPKDGSVIERNMSGSVSSFGQGVTYFESLVSVKSGTYARKEPIEDQLQQKRAKKKNKTMHA